MATVPAALPQRRTRDDTTLGRAWGWARRTAPRLRTWAVTTAPRARSATLHTAGLGFLCAAAFAVTLVAGLAAVGVSCLVLEWLTAPTTRR